MVLHTRSEVNQMILQHTSALLPQNLVFSSHCTLCHSELLCFWHKISQPGQEYGRFMTCSQRKESTNTKVGLLMEVRFCHYSGHIFSHYSLSETIMAMDINQHVKHLVFQKTSLKNYQHKCKKQLRNSCNYHITSDCSQRKYFCIKLQIYLLKT